MVDLHKRYGDVVALDGCSFEVHPGRMLGFLGPNSAGRGPAFSVGIDLEMLGGMRPEGRSETAARVALYGEIKRLQATMSCLADCPKPVVAAVHGYCLGAGIDLITACDMRLATADAVFAVRETRMALVADVGTLQRLPD